MIASPNQYF